MSLSSHGICPGRPCSRVETGAAGRATRAAISAALCCLATATASAAAGAAVASSSSAVSSRELHVALASKTATDSPRVSQLLALLEDRPQKVVRISEAPQWQVSVYFDAPLTTSDGVRQAARYLARTAELLIELGPTEIVLADPLPELYLERSRDALAVAKALRDLQRDVMTAGELQWQRQRFLERPENADEAALSAHKLREEVHLLEQQRWALLHWLAQQEPTGPRLLILVQNGCDLNPRSFFVEQTGETFLEDPRTELVHADFTRVIASDGWTVLGVALGPRPAEFNDPLGPLEQLVAATGGMMVTSRGDLVRSVQQIASWPVAVVAVEGLDDGEPRPFELRDQALGTKIRTAQWASVSRPEVILMASERTSEAARERTALRLLHPEGLTTSGKVRFRTITGHRRIDRVAFLLDGREVTEDESAPFTATIDLGPTARPCTVSAVAYSPSGHKVAEDRLELNMSLVPAEVVIQEMDFDPRASLLTVTASATAPLGESPEALDFYLNQRLAETSNSPPYTARIPASELEATDYIRVVARYPSGAVAEAAKLPAAAGLNDELDVNLVELLAMVRSRSRDADLELKRGDFVIRRDGELTRIEHFARWHDRSLTLGLVLDTSDSMLEVIQDARSAAEKFLQQALREDDEAFLVDFNSLPRLARATTTDPDQLLSAFERLQARGATALYDAIVFSLLQFEHSKGRRALVVLTDGEDSASRYQPRECVRQARLQGVPVYLIVLGTPPDPNRESHFLRNQVLATRTGGQVYYVSDLEELNRIYDEIGEELRQQYFLSFSSGRSLSPAELEAIEVDVVRKGISVRTLLASQQRGG